MAVNHLIFDLGNTLIDFDLGLVSKGLSKALGRPESTVYDFLFKSPFFPGFERGEIGPDEVVALVNREFDSDLSLHSFDRIFSPIFSQRDEMVKLVASLKKEYELSILSNTNVLHCRYLEENFPLLQTFDHRFYSFILGTLKPEADIFRQVLARTHSGPEECLFIDDLKMHVDGARNFGIDAIHFQGEEMLIGELENRGIV